MGGENIANHTSNKGLRSRKYMENSSHSVERQITWLKSEQMIWRDISPIKVNRANEHVKRSSTSFATR